jgi:hypothetical protein
MDMAYLTALATRLTTCIQLRAFSSHILTWQIFSPPNSVDKCTNHTQIYYDYMYTFCMYAGGFQGFLITFCGNI